MEKLTFQQTPIKNWHDEAKKMCEIFCNQKISWSAVDFLVRDVIYTSRAYATVSVSVCLSVTEVHWRIIANLGFTRAMAWKMTVLPPVHILWPSEWW